MRGEDDDLRRRADLLYLAQRGQAVYLWHEEVEQDHGRHLLADSIDRLFPIGRFADDLDVTFLLQQESQALPHHLVVVADQHPNHCGVTGSRAVTTVPSPARLATVKVPPNSSTRSRINRRPSPCVPPFAPVTKPWPSSEIVISAKSPRRCSASPMLVAWACLIAFARPSCAMRSAATSAAGASDTGSRSASTRIASRWA